MFSNHAAPVVVFIKAFQSFVAYRPDHTTNCNVLRNGRQVRVRSTLPSNML
jgi:hypothetical protein